MVTEESKLVKEINFMGRKKKKEKEIDKEEPIDTSVIRNGIKHNEPYHPPPCEYCRSERTRVTRTMKPTRYIKCDRCNHTFKR